MIAALALSVAVAQNPLADKGVFPIAVWLQSPAMATKYKAAGINLYVGLWDGPTEEQLARLKGAGMSVVCDQNEVGLRHVKDKTIVAWMHGDEPDNAQPTPGGGYGPCVPPQRIVDDYRRIKAKDPTRPVLLNLGQGVANDRWIGRGSGAKLSDYETYVKGSDIVSFDVYPMASLHNPDEISLVAKGVRRLVGWTGGRQRVWNCLECTDINGEGKATPDQVKAQAWSAIISGSRGLIYFVHQFKPSFDEHALLDDPTMLAAVTKLNAQIQRYARRLDDPVAQGVGATGDGVLSFATNDGKRVTIFIASILGRSTKARLTAHANQLVDSESGKKVNLTDGSGTITLQPYEVEILQSP